MAEMNPMVQISAVVGGVSLGIVVVTAIVAVDYLWITPAVVGVLAVMGIVMGAMARKKPEDPAAPQDPQAPAD